MIQVIQYPFLEKGMTIGVTAPSSGVEKPLHHLLEQAVIRLEAKGFHVVCGQTVWTQNKAKSAPADIRADELNAFLQDDKIGMIFPPWGGELFMEIVDKIEYERIQLKWILGYSDTSVLLLAVTLMTGIATAHGTNLIDLRGIYSDQTTAKWETVLSTLPGKMNQQTSSERYQKEWKHGEPSPCIFELTERTEWKTTFGTDVILRGRLLGGCIDVIRHLIGTPYGDVLTFQREYIHGEPILWYFENCELSAADLCRTLVQMRLAGWFAHCSGILFGRSHANKPVEGYDELDVYEEISKELSIAVVYDIDCGHMPPQITFVNGASAEVQVCSGIAVITQSFEL